MTEKEIELQVLLDHISWIEKIADEDQRVTMNKIKNEINANSKVRKMRPYELRGKTITFVK